MSFPQRSPWAQVAVRFEGTFVGYHDNVLRPHTLWLQLCPFDFVVVGFASQDARQSGVFASAAADLGVHGRIEEIL